MDKIVIIVATKSIETHMFKKFYEILKRNTKLCYRLIIVETPNNNIESDGVFNFPKVMNIALKGIEAEYYVLINDDVFVKEGWLEPLIETAEQDSKIGIVGSLIFNPDGTRYWTSNFDKQRDILYFEFSVALITKLCIEKIGLLDEVLKLSYNDSDYCYRAWINGFRVVQQPKSQVIHIHGATRNLGCRYEMPDMLPLIKKRWFSGNQQQHLIDLVVASNERYKSTNNTLKELKIKPNQPKSHTRHHHHHHGQNPTPRPPKGTKVLEKEDVHY